MIEGSAPNLQRTRAATKRRAARPRVAKPNADITAPESLTETTDASAALPAPVLLPAVSPIEDAPLDLEEADFSARLAAAVQAWTAESSVPAAESSAPATELPAATPETVESSEDVSADAPDPTAGAVNSFAQADVVEEDDDVESDEAFVSETLLGASELVAYEAPVEPEIVEETAAALEAAPDTEAAAPLAPIDALLAAFDAAEEADAAAEFADTDADALVARFADPARPAQPRVEEFPDVDSADEDFLWEDDLPPAPADAAAPGMGDLDDRTPPSNGATGPGAPGRPDGLRGALGRPAADLAGALVPPRNVTPAPRAMRGRAKLPRKPAPPRPIDGSAAGQVLGELTGLGVSDGFARDLIHTAAAHGAAAVGGLRGAVRQELTRRLASAPSLPLTGATVAFVGTGGSGKTVATAALAASYRYGSTLPVSVFSMCETHDHRRLADLLAPDEVPVLSAPEGSSRPALGARRAITDARQGGVVILDTPAVSPADLEALDHLTARLQEIRPDAVYLVLSAALGMSAARRAVAGLAALDPVGLVISHADETDQVGVLIELAASEGLPIAYVTAGADHHQSLLDSDPAALAQLLLP